MKGRGLRSPLPGVSGLSGRDGRVYERPMYKVKGGLNVSKNRDAQSPLEGHLEDVARGKEGFLERNEKGGGSWE